MSKQWIVAPPGGPAGPFWGIVSSSGRVIAMQIPDEAVAREIVALRAELAAVQAKASLADDLIEQHQAEIVILRRQVADQRQAMVNLGRSNVEVVAAYSGAITQLKAANAELHELRIRLGMVQP